MASGVQTVQFSDRMTTYRSMSDLVMARDFFVGQVAQLSGRPKQSVAYGEKGFLGPGTVIR
jgi:hypothetical protein